MKERLDVSLSWSKLTAATTSDIIPWVCRFRLDFYSSTYSGTGRELFFDKWPNRKHWKIHKVLTPTSGLASFLLASFLLASWWTKASQKFWQKSRFSLQMPFYSFVAVSIYLFMLINVWWRAVLSRKCRSGIFGQGTFLDVCTSCALTLFCSPQLVPGPFYFLYFVSN